jgi:hypothetical protein
LDPGERLERRTGRSTTFGAVAIRGVDERIYDLVAHGAAPAFPLEHTLRHDIASFIRTPSAVVKG